MRLTQIAVLLGGPLDGTTVEVEQPCAVIRMPAPEWPAEERLSERDVTARRAFVELYRQAGSRYVYAGREIAAPNLHEM